MYKADKSMIIETHSEHLIRGLQIQVAKGNIPVENIAICAPVSNTFNRIINYVCFNLIKCIGTFHNDLLFQFLFQCGFASKCCNEKNNR